MGEQTYVTRTPAATKPLKKSAFSFFKADLVLMVVVIVLVVFGLVMVYSSSWNFSILKYDSPEVAAKRQLGWAIAGFIVAGICMFLNYHIYTRLALPIILVTVIILLIVLLFPSGDQDVRGTLFGYSVQPSELAKIAIVIYLSVWLYSKREILHKISFGLVPLGAIVGSIAGLIALQPDLSAALSIILLGGALFFLADSELRQIILLVLLILVFGAVFIAFSDTGKGRITEYWNGIQNLGATSDHIHYSLRAIVEGGIFGKGLGKGSIKVIGLPVAWTDSIYAVIAEELGLLGALTVLSLYVVVLWRGIRISRRAPDKLGMLLAGGITIWIAFEALVNMSVMVNLLPFAGNPLPFISTGGSSLVSCLAAVGILLNISRQGQNPQQKERSGDFAAYRRRRRDRRRSVPSSRRSTNAQS